MNGETIIATEILNRTVLSIESRLNNHTELSNSIKYHNLAFNESLKKDFDQIIEVLQAVVDKFYIDNYMVDSYVYFNLCDIEFCKNHNMSILNSMKKLLKFIN